MEPSDTQTSHNTPDHLDPTIKVKVQRLHQLTVYGRWLFVGILWISVAPLSLWGWRYELLLLQEHFTWSGLRYSIAFNRLPILGLAICIGMTTAVLVWQSRNILFGIPPAEKQRLVHQVRRISDQGPSHPLWKWVCDRG
ncbi:hypothetical protein [Coleofasciculus sp. F4-SAH-05]|jgi:hypothetical protein|uniref:hypothetical protein n=1 Tax=Coleofasciculus TaxID=669368 RepID=UPI003302DBE9